MDYVCNYKIHSSGSMKDLINRTSNNEPVYKKFSEKILASNNIFQPDNAPYRRKKRTVSLDVHNSKKYVAGRKNKLNDEIKIFNIVNYT
jgi:hypothetical protein